MMNVVAAEIRKLTTVRTTWVLTLAGIALVGFNVGLFVFSNLTGDFTGADEQWANLIGQVTGNSAFALVVAIMLVTTEFRHGTIGRTLQLVPSRTKVMLSKLTAGGFYGAVFFVVALPVMFIIGIIGGGFDIGANSFDALWQGLIATVLTAIFGIAIGALIRSQVVALVVSLVWLFIVEPLATVFLPSVGRWLPFQLVSDLFTPEEMSEAMAAAEGAPMMADPVAAPLGITVFFGYVALATVGAGLLLRYRDV